ncbi:hypothetical protein AUEXF2481DRAFT_3158 [Aureobasidium subglaciale EXF-2481]|uniref:RNA polymerase II degradation factor 1 n=1 Tax=Aureobasidium subglaciale (strain EXF-2481) TaxID=1043005 RepID=A0A074ZFD9_AURSE|nr:uncharacterized protein AUEXF2481DRAFT_3158 [Aureobasidium subglaciale EXF-2481]KAI5205930.1 hypothetical protein E4T38_04045 [Aureobasidium subglaciale]KAI5224821.1 hypothetical protein E4T40_03820 [Aureobasidium subglaciale]KAI5227916.1 hypothetical protein E4T41_04040 [Aureobasidium subglaciale]KAI5263484.1 hypothetical protein E4T46_03661 [Aureobasidium subglaciale]KEQ97331.1 hypothetical protein AUEXF2481DRAFT_3158 [Aureobasidium subglaciale EXF-2481]
MSEIDSRPVASRGRSSTRGGRASNQRGPPRQSQNSSTAPTSSVQFDESFDDQGELGNMKKTYSTQLSFMRDMFPQWTDDDLVFAIAEADGDVQIVIDRITQGNVSQFAQVPKKGKDRARSKAKDSSAAAGAEQTTTPLRGGRGRGGFESSRGGRGRGIDRGRGGFRGARGGHAVATDSLPKDAPAVSIPTTESSAWDNVAAEAAPALAWDTPAATEQGAWGNATTTDSAPVPVHDVAKTVAVSESSGKKTWASMFAKPKPPPVPAVPQQPAQAAVPAAAVESTPAVVEQSEQTEPPSVVLQETTTEPAQQPELDTVPTAIEEQPTEIEQTETAPIISEPSPAATEPSALASETDLSSSHAPLTEDNLEHLPDTSVKPATQTVASTVGSIDPRVATPATSQQAPIGRPPMGGYAASAYRAAGTPGRNSSYQRRVLEQQEAVVMPGHNAVDRAAVQFGSMGLNGEPDSLDVDEEREEPETRTQPPQQSPPSQPRASLPPAPRQPSLTQEPSIHHDTVPTPKQAPGLPPVPQQSYGGHQDASHIGSIPQESAQSHAYGQYSRYGQSGMQQPDMSAQSQKSFDPFSHQAPSTAYDHYASQHSAQQHQPFAAFSSAPSDYSQYYTADQQRNAYQSYYGGSYGQQASQSQDNTAHQQRSSSGFGSAPSDSAYSASQAPQQVSNAPSLYSKEHDPHSLSQSRYGEAPGSGHNTPAPTNSQIPSAAPSAAMHQQPHSQYNPAYPYGHPYYQSPYHAAYQNQFGYQQPAYGSPFGGKGAMYGQPHGYGMNSASSYEHSASPANASGYSAQPSMQSRDTGISSGLGDYGRSAAQPSNLSSGFGGMSEPFGRSQSGYQGQTQGYGQQQTSGQADDLKPFGESKTGGPSPGLGQPGRPSSAANSVGGQTPSTTLPPPQSHQAGFGGYPGFNSQYGLGGLGGQGHQQQQQQQQQQQGGYGGYGSGFGNSYYGARGGWGGNYGGH